MSAFFQDLRYALRGLLRSPGFSTIAIATLALGIGANTAIFSVVHAVLLQPLPFRDADRVLSVMETWQGRRGDVSGGNFADLRLANRSFERLAAVRYTSFNLSHGDEPQRVVGASVTQDFFAVFGIQPELGRVFVPEEDRPGAAHVVVLSHRLWTGRLASDPSLLGRSLRLDGEPYTVLGVMPAAFDYAQNNEELWVPAALPPAVLSNHDDHDLVVFGLRKTGVALAAVQQDADEIMRGLERRFPRDDLGRGFRVDHFRDVLVERYRERLWILFGAVGLVLLIACTNVSNMLLARSAGRSREIHIRAALGASRARIARQLLTECLVLGLAGGALGALVAASAVQALVSLAPGGVPRIEQASIDGGALAFALSISIASSLIFGLLPLARMARGDLQTALRLGGRGSRPGGRRDRIRTALVAGQIALALTLLVGAGLLIRTAIHLQHVPPGFRASGVLTASITLPAPAFADPIVTQRTLEDIVQQLEGMPNVASAAVTTQIPLGPGGNSNGLLAEAPMIDVTKAVDARLHVVTPHYFRVMGIPILRGRGFGPEDAAGNPRSMIVSRKLADRLWPGQDPLGRRVGCCEGSPEDPKWKTVVGIAGDVRSRGAREETYPEFYLPMGQAPGAAWDWIQRTVTLTARAADGRAAALGAVVRSASKRAAPGIPLYDIQTMEQRLQGSLSEERFHTLLLVALGGIGLLLAAIGIYGIIAYFVAQRTGEFGVRIALGATPRDILLVTARHSLLPIGLGLGAGIVASLAAARVLSAVLRGVGPSDPLTFVTVVLVLAAAAALATYLPARRATKIDPMTALRTE
jgi:putative ABC transport system permease protein